MFGHGPRDRGVLNGPDLRPTKKAFRAGPVIIQTDVRDAQSKLDVYLPLTYSRAIQHIYGRTIMHTSTVTFFPTKTGTGFRGKLRTLLAEIFYALDLSNRAYYQGINRF